MLKETLLLIKENSNALPPLKGIAEGLYRVIEIIYVCLFVDSVPLYAMVGIHLLKAMKGKKVEAERLVHAADALLELLVNTIPKSSDIPPKLFLSLEVLNRCFLYLFTKQLSNYNARGIEELALAACNIPEKHRLIRVFYTSDEKDVFFACPSRRSSRRYRPLQCGYMSRPYRVSSSW